MPPSCEDWGLPWPSIAEGPSSCPWLRASPAISDPLPVTSDRGDKTTCLSFNHHTGMIRECLCSQVLDRRLTGTKATSADAGRAKTSLLASARAACWERAPPARSGPLECLNSAQQHGQANCEGGRNAGMAMVPCCLPPTAECAEVRTVGCSNRRMDLCPTLAHSARVVNKWKILKDEALCMQDSLGSDRRVAKG